MIYSAGRGLQLAGLLVLPSSIWAGAIDHSEFKAIALFAGCLVVFYAGYFLTRWSMRVQ
jgi:hypothetical protein